MSESFPSAELIAALQKDRVAAWHHTEPKATQEEPFLRLVEKNSLRNFTLWHHEDDARREDMGFEFIYHAKRAIDAANQQRNDFIEKMDKALFAAFQANFGQSTPMNTETPGMCIDRLSILSLKEFHMREEVERADASAEHKAKCRCLTAAPAENAASEYTSSSRCTTTRPSTPRSTKRVPPKSPLQGAPPSTINRLWCLPSLQALDACWSSNPLRWATSSTA